MSIFGRILPIIATNFQRSIYNTLLPRSNFHAIAQQSASPSLNPGGLFDISTRNIIRCHFPKPSERKRIKKHGYWKRMSTAAGRRIIMRRILKGRHVLSH
ncbi:Ribosomal protein L34 [Popillia japonica]|uniref:Large ribosomal subunit protein bL34m n=1 Tax=Popillia japonica TaxID=7064 RepID=A0AAW1MY27_POPJA